MKYMRGNGNLQNAVVRAVLEEFRPRFIPQGLVLWVNEARKPAIDVSDEDVRELGLKRGQRRQLPNVVLHDKERGWLVLIDVPGIRGPMSAKRRDALRRAFGAGGFTLVAVNAFKSRLELQELLAEPPWGTSAWIADEPDHMIHFNGPKFLGPYK
jgi:adenine-specific DNA-methyltransferase